jgi:FMN phosphatase YigB (HAD superfamily)/DNA-binding XRE family transcriptional regulator
MAMGEETINQEKILGKRIQALRKAGGLTQQALCQQADLSYSTLAKIERGAIRSPSIFTVQSIAEALSISVDSIIGSSPVASTSRKLNKSKSGVSFVYFDVNGCLVRFYQRAFSKIAEDYGVPADVVETAFWHYNDEVCRGDMSIDEFNKELATKLNIDSINWQKYYLDAAEPVPEADRLVTWTLENYKVGLLTNIMPGLLASMRDNNQIPNIAYDSIVDSSQVGAIKPETKVYEIATQKAGCDPKEILLIDDNRANLTAAEKQGWHVLWFDYARPEESVANIREALALV